MPDRTPSVRPVVDWSAAFWAGALAGTVFLLLNAFVSPRFVGGNAWVFLRLLASIPLGSSVLAPPATFSAGAVAVALAVHYALSFGFAILVTSVLHRWGFWVGFFGGAVFGWALWAINIHSLTAVFPAFISLEAPVYIWTHVAFGALAGGIYELLEEEEFQGEEA